MTQPAAIPPPAEASNADKVIAALGALLIAGTSAAVVTKLLGTLKGVTSASVSALFADRKLSKLLGKKVTDPGQKAANSARIRHVAAREQAKARAAYIVRATLRLAPAYASGDKDAIAAAKAREDTYLVAHAKAASARQTATNALIKEVGSAKPDDDGAIMLGWYAEEQACPTCAAADGHDFDVFNPPAIGWPGFVHPSCYCSAGPPHGNGLVDDVITEKRSKAMNTETRTAVITEIRGPGTSKPDAKPGFTAKLVSYGVPDTYRTSWQQGVFAQALEKRSVGGHSIPVVWDHNWSDPVGRVTGYRDQKDGFYGDVEFDDLEAVPRAKQAYAQIRSGTMGQFSFAFVRGEETEDSEHRGVMRQTSVEDLQEFSIVLNGSVPGTGVQTVRSAKPGTVDATRAADIVTRFGAGQLDLADALVELRGAAQPGTETRKATHEFRALGDATNVDPTAVLAAVDAAMVSVAGQLDKGEVEAARKYFSQAASRLSELQYALAMVPGVEGYGESYSWRKLDAATTETRGGTEGGGGEAEPFPERAHFELRRPLAARHLPRAGRR